MDQGYEQREEAYFLFCRILPKSTKAAKIQCSYRFYDEEIKMFWNQAALVFFLQSNLYRIALYE